MANCVPTVPVQPDAAYYPVSRLYTVPTYTRAAYQAAFGEDAPTYDSTRKTKTWFDSTAIETAGSESAAIEYSVIAKDNSGNVVPTRISMTAKEAATVNLYGIKTYPAYRVAATAATYMGGPLNPVNLSLQADAVALAESLGLDASAVTEFASDAYPAGESRRVWMITLNGVQHNVGLLLAEENEHGVGAPGHWDLTSATEPTWISEIPTSLAAENSAWNVPCRPLAANEAIAVNMFSFMIYRTDRQSVFNPTVAA